MSKKNFNITFLILFSLFLLTQCSMLAEDAFENFSESDFINSILTIEKWIDYNEWSNFYPSNDSRLIYISADGNDNTGVIYAPGDTEIGSDPFNPSGPINAFSSYEVARTYARNGMADWILFRRGDVFTACIRPLSGKDSSSPALVGAFGDSGNLPQIHSEVYEDNTTSWNDRRPCISLYARRGENCRNSVITSLDFCCPDKDPNNGNLSNVYAGGLALMSLEDGIIENLLIEGCQFKYFDNNAIQRLNNATLCNIVIKRCHFLDNYTYQTSNGHSQGLYAYRVDGLFLIENIFDHNGWLNQAPQEGAEPVGKATIFNHNTYLEDCNNVEFWSNISMRPSSINFKFTAETGVASSTKILIHENLIVDGELGISIGGNQTDADRFNKIALYNNLITEIGRSRPTNRDLLWGIIIQDWKDGLISRNLFTHFHNPTNSDNGFAISFDGSLNDTHFFSNTIYNTLGYGITIGSRTSSQRVNNYVWENKIQNDMTTEWIKVISAETLNGIQISDNFYTSLYNEMPFHYGGNWNISFDEWHQLTNDSSYYGTIQYSHPERSVSLYNSQILSGEESVNAFIQACKNQNRYQWNESLKAVSIINWIDSGYDS